MSDFIRSAKEVIVFLLFYVFVYLLAELHKNY